MELVDDDGDEIGQNGVVERKQEDTRQEAEDDQEPLQKGQYQEMNVVVGMYYSLSGR